MKRILAPKTRKAEVDMDQYFSQLDKDARDEEEAEDTTINPIVAARMKIEQGVSQMRTREPPRTPLRACCVPTSSTLRLP